jgi:flagellar biosynthetic protein FlhB
MAAETGERTEPATPRRRTEARARGQVARSPDLAAATGLLAGFILLEIFGARIWFALLQVVRDGLQPQKPWSLGESVPLAASAGRGLLVAVGPMLAILLLAVLSVLYVQIGPLLTFQPLTPTLTKINPLEGLRRLFSGASWVSAAMNLAKLLVVVLVVYIAMTGSLASILFSFVFSSTDVLLLGCRLTLRLGLALSAAFFVLALLDYGWQRFRHERSLRMTKEEVKDELRSMEGDPAIKKRRRQLQLRLALQRLRKDVPKADVVVTNPTHLAVALAYDSATMIAPKVVAKGADEMAIRIRQIARKFGIPVVERKPLARALYESVEVGQTIPERFYRAIAEILAYVYELTGRMPRVATA